MVCLHVVIMIRKVPYRQPNQVLCNHESQLFRNVINSYLVHGGLFVVVVVVAVVVDVH